MRRHRKSGLERTINELLLLPWWVSVIVGGAILVGFLVLAVTSGGSSAGRLPTALSWLAFVLFGGTAIGSAIRARRERNRLMHVRSLVDLRGRGWQAFEAVTGAYYRELGYIVVQTGAAGPDGGYDVVLRRDGKRVLVQCKCYARDPIGVEKVRELLGVVAAEGADRGIFITTSSFTPAAFEFGMRNARLELIAGDRFARMVAAVQRSKFADESIPEATPEPAPSPCCPKCAAPMVLREARRGRWEGRSFWGCPTYPRCDGIRRAA